MRSLLFLILLSLAQFIHAGNVYRCVAAGGAVSYQSQPCGSGQRLDRTVAYQPDALPEAAGQAHPLSQRQPRLQRRHGRSRTLHAPQAQMITHNQRCRAGKAQRELALQRLGLKRTYAQLSALDAQVRQACSSG